MFTNKAIKVLLVICCLLPTSVIFSQQIGLEGEGGIEPFEYERVGQSGWQFLKLSTNPRQIAMGGAMTGLAYKSSANSVFSNPADLTTSGEQFLFSANRVHWFADIGLQTLALSKYVKPLGGHLGISLIYLDYGDIVEAHYVRDSERPDIAYVSDLGSFTANDMAFAVSYAREVTNKLSFGVNAKYIREEIDEYSMSTWVVDVGTNYRTGFNSLRLSLLARNFGPDSRLINYQLGIQRNPTSVKTPMQFIGGLAYDVLDKETSPHFLTVALEAIHPNDGKEKVNCGVEYIFRDLLSLRGGYRFNYDEESLTLGCGIKTTINDIDCSINYGWADFGRLDYIQAFSVDICF